MPKKQSQLAKLTRPRLYGAVARERLLNLLDQHKDRPVVWVSGPPGSGKTTLVASYIENRHLSALWYQLDEADGDPASFFYYLNELVEQGSRRQRRSLPYLTPEYLADLSEFARRYFRQFFRLLKLPSLLVLDNCQEALSERLGVVLREACMEVPEGLRVIVISRTDPLSSLSRLSLSGQMTRIGWDELRLTIDESRAIAERGNAPSVHEDVAAMHARVDGWMAGFVLLLSHLRRGGKVDGTADARSKDALFDYFAGEILERTSQKDSQTLLRLALLPRFTVPMAEQISEDRDAGKLLDYLYHRRYFIEHRANDNQTYQFHDLFREFLAARLKDELEPRDLISLQCRAAQILAAHGHTDEAVELAIVGADMALAARLVASIAATLMETGQWQKLLDWLSQLPAGAFEEDPWLRYWLGLTRLQSDPASAYPHLEQAYEQFVAAGDEQGQFYAAQYATIAIHQQMANWWLLDRWIQILEGKLERMAEFAPLAAQLGAWSAFLASAFARKMGHPLIGSGVRWLMGQLSQTGLGINQKLDAGALLLWNCWLAGDFELGERVCERILPLSEKPEVAPQTRMWWTYAYWTYLGLTNRNEAAIEVSSHGIELSTRYNLTGWVANAHIFRSFWFTAIGELKRAAAEIDAFSHLPSMSQPRDKFWEYKARALLASAYGEVGQALQHGKMAIRLLDESGYTVVQPYLRGDMAPMAIVAGELELGRKWLEEGEAITKGTIQRALDAQYEGARAFLYLKSGDRESAVATLRHALALARNPGQRGGFRWIGPGLESLFYLAFEEDIEVDLVKQFIREWRIKPSRTATERWPWRVKLYSLGRFAVEIDGEPVVYSKKAPKRPLALLKALIAHGGENVPIARLLDDLWPTEEGDAANEACKVALSRLRKLLGNAEVLKVDNGRISIDADQVWVDAFAFEREADSAADSARIETLYRGHFLPEEREAPWALSMRERLRGKFIRHVARRGHRLEEQGEFDAAANLFQRGIDTDDLAEELYQGLMRCHARRGRRAEAISVYRRLRQILSITLGIAPSQDSDALLHSLQ